MDPRALERFLHKSVPLSRTMRVAVRSATPEGVTLEAPLEPNINHHETAFGGSVSALALLTAWSTLHVKMHAERLHGKLVVRSNTIEYLKPITGSFTASAVAPDAAQMAAVRETLERGRPARLRLQVRIEFQGTQTGALDGEFVVLPAT